MNYKGHIIKERYKNETKAHTSYQVLIEKMKEENWTVASQIARNDEMFIFIEDPEGRLPIHYVVNLGGPISLMDIILTCYPVCISIRDPNGDLPIHLATRHNHESLTIKIRVLQALKIRDRKNHKKERKTSPVHVSSRIYRICHGGFRQRAPPPRPL